MVETDFQSNLKSLSSEDTSKPFKKARLNIRDNLARIDELRTKAHGKHLTSLTEFWDEANKFTDMNEAIRLNMQQMETHLQDAESMFWERQNHFHTLLEKLIDEGENSYDKYQETFRQCQDEAHKDRKHIQDLQKTVLRLAQEYRQCAMQKQWSVHKSLVIQFLMSIQAAIHRNVPDKQVRDALAEDLEEATRSLFVLSADTNI